VRGGFLGGDKIFRSIVLLFPERVLLMFQNLLAKQRGVHIGSGHRRRSIIWGGVKNAGMPVGRGRQRLPRGLAPLGYRLLLDLQAVSGPSAR